MIGAIVLALALTSPPAAAPAAEPTPLPAWLQVVPQSSPDVKSIWERLNTERARRFGALAAGREPDEIMIRMHAPRVLMSEPEGELAGDWTFLRAEGATRPHAGYRLRWDGGAGYGWIADLYCQPGIGCDAAQSALAAQRAPLPPDPAQRAAWVGIVATEACEPGPVHTPAPDYPSRAKRQGMDGQVALALFVNRCGDVRDAWVVESTGYRELDREAVRAARHWKTAPVPDGEATGTYSVKLDFSLDSDG